MPAIETDRTARKALKSDPPEFVSETLSPARNAKKRSKSERRSERIKVKELKGGAEEWKIL